MNSKLPRLTGTWSDTASVGFKLQSQIYLVIIGLLVFERFLNCFSSCFNLQMSSSHFRMGFLLMLRDCFCFVFGISTSKAPRLVLPYILLHHFPLSLSIFQNPSLLFPLSLYLVWEFHLSLSYQWFVWVRHSPRMVVPSVFPFRAVLEADSFQSPPFPRSS